jgi:hypothetical protein
MSSRRRVVALKKQVSRKFLLHAESPVVHLSHCDFRGISGDIRSLKSSADKNAAARVHADIACVDHGADFKKASGCIAKLIYLSLSLCRSRSTNRESEEW